MKHLVGPYVNALISEVESLRAYETAWRASSLYLGGGTPSLLAADAVRALVEAVRLAPGAEISLEANPGTLDAGLLSGLRKIGVNRLSLGMQSAVQQELHILGRSHDLEDVKAAVGWARAADLHSINLDLIYGIPGQGMEEWEHSLAAALSLGPEHLSLYALTIEPGTPIEGQIRRGEIEQQDPDLTADLYDFARETLSTAGFVQYEISNWTLPGHQCIHNLAYWRNDNYLGIGAGAWGHWLKPAGRGSWRIRNVAHPRAYIERLQRGSKPPVAAADFPISPACDEWESITRPMSMAESMFMGLRLVQEGVSRSNFAVRYGVDPVEHYSQVLDDLERRGLIDWNDERIWLPAGAILISNQALASFLPEDE